MSIKKSLVVFTCAVLFTAIFAAPAFAAEGGKVIKNFGNKFFIEARNTFAEIDTADKEARLPLRNSGAVAPEESGVQYVPSAAIETKKLADAGSGKIFEKATLTAEHNLPSGTAISYFLTADGLHWEEVAPLEEHEFRFLGRDLRFRAVLQTDDVSRTPALKSLRIDYKKDRPLSLDTLRREDDKRISDLNNIARRLETFKRERRSYPVAEEQNPQVRYELLERLLVEGDFITSMPQDPESDEDPERVYDYIAKRDGTAYLLRVRFDSTHKKLETDIDGSPLEAAFFSYTCDDPWYCAGKPDAFFDALKRRTVAEEIKFPEPQGAEEIMRSDDGRVWRIATVGGADRPPQKRKLYIPAPDLLERLKGFYGRMKNVGKSELDYIARARLVKTADKNDVYYITETNLKRWIPNWEVFLSYGNDPREIVTAHPEELDSYKDSRLVRLIGDTRVWLLEGGARRYIPNPAALRARGFDWREVAPVNFQEYNTYPEGAPLE